MDEKIIRNDMRNIIKHYSEDKGKDPNDVASKLFNFGNKIDWTDSEISIDISNGIDKDELKKEMRGLYKGTDEAFEEDFGLFFDVVDQTGDGFLGSKELTILDGDNKGDSDITGKSLWGSFVNDNMVLSFNEEPAVPNIGASPNESASHSNGIEQEDDSEIEEIDESIINNYRETFLENLNGNQTDAEKLYNLGQDYFIKSIEKSNYQETGEIELDSTGLGMSAEKLKLYLEDVGMSSDDIELFMKYTDLDGDKDYYTIEELSLFMDNDQNKISNKSIGAFLFNDKTRAVKDNQYSAVEGDGAVIPLSALPPEAEQVDGKIYMDGIEIGYISSKSIGNEETGVCHLYGSAANLPENCLFDKDGNIHTFDDENKDLGILIPQSEDKCTINTDEETQENTIIIAGNKYTVSGTDLLDEDGNKAGKVWFEGDSKVPGAVFLFADIDAKVSKNIPEDKISVDRKTGEMTTSDGKELNPAKITKLMKKRLKGETDNNITLTKVGDTEPSEYRPIDKGVMEPGLYEMTDNEGYPIGYMSVNERNERFFFTEKEENTDAAE